LNKIYIILLSILLTLQPGCRSQQLNFTQMSQYGIFHYCEQDTQAVKDLLQCCATVLPGIAGDLNLTAPENISIEIYPTQNDYNRNIMNPALQNSPAISGNGKIQLVSPLAKIKIDNLTYEERLLLLVHEYVHILIDGLDPEPPLFIDEGIACYYSSYQFYKSAAAQYVKQINFIPTTSQLKDHYHELPAPDLFSFLFIDYLVQQQGKQILPAVLTQPQLLDDILNTGWLEFVKQHYY